MYYQINYANKLLFVEDLNACQLRQLKTKYYAENGHSVNDNELFTIDDIITDEEIKAVYAGITFKQTDFKQS